MKVVISLNNCNYSIITVILDNVDSRPIIGPKYNIIIYRVVSH